MPAMTTRFDPFREFWPEVFARLPARAPEGVPAEIRQKEGERVLLRELVSGSVARSFTLAQDIDEAAVQARLEDGVLTLLLPKRSGGGARRIEIQ